MMTDSVTSSAITAGDQEKVRTQEQKVDALFGGAKTGTSSSAAIDEALEAVSEYPSIGAFAVIEMARADAGWTASKGAKNGKAAYIAFATNLQKSGWFQPKRKAMLMTPQFDLDIPVPSLMNIAKAAYPDLNAADQKSAAAALIRSLSHALGPDGVPPEPEDVPEGLLGKAKVIERRVTTVASHVLSVGQNPTFDMHWLTTTFERTKNGKDKPKDHHSKEEKNYGFIFDVERWKSGDRSALIEYYRRVDNWLSNFNTSDGKARNMSCFASIL